jgi:hypothetical protein
VRVVVGCVETPARPTEYDATLASSTVVQVGGGMKDGVSRAAKVLCCMLLAGCASEAPARYSNPEYAYAVRLPRGLRIETSTPPNPNHGFRARVPPPASVWVSADYDTENVNTLAEEVQAVRGIWHGCRMEGPKPATLGGVAAAELTFHCPAASGGGPETMKLLLTLRTPPDRGSAGYTVGLQYPEGTPAPAEAEQVYRALVDGFSFIRG